MYAGSIQFGLVGVYRSLNLLNARLVLDEALKARIREWGSLRKERDKELSSAQGDLTLPLHHPMGQPLSRPSFISRCLTRAFLPSPRRSPSAKLGSRRSVSRESKAGCGVKNNQKSRLVFIRQQFDFPLQCYLEMCQIGPPEAKCELGFGIPIFISRAIQRLAKF